MDIPKNPQDWKTLKEEDPHLAEKFNKLFNDKDNPEKNSIPTHDFILKII